MTWVEYYATIYLVEKYSTEEVIVELNSIKRKRLEAGLTQEALAEKLDVEKSTISKWETGEALPSIPNLLKLADIFECSLDELLERETIIKANTA